LFFYINHERINNGIFTIFQNRVGDLFFVLFIVFLSDRGVVIVNIKLFNVGFFGDFEILLNLWRFLFLLIVVLIRRRVLIFSCSYIRGIIVGNFIFLYFSFIIRMVWLVLINGFY